MLPLWKLKSFYTENEYKKSFAVLKKFLPVTPSSIFEFKPKDFILEMEKFKAITVLSIQFT